MSYWHVLEGYENPLDAFKWYNGGEKGFNEFLEGRNLSNDREFGFLGSLRPGMFLNNKGTSPYQIVEAGDRFIPPGYELVGRMPATSITRRPGYGFIKPGNMGSVEGITERLPGYYIVQKENNTQKGQEKKKEVNRDLYIPQAGDPEKLTMISYEGKLPEFKLAGTSKYKTALEKPRNIQTIVSDLAEANNERRDSQLFDVVLNTINKKA